MTVITRKPDGTEYKIIEKMCPKCKVLKKSMDYNINKRNSDGLHHVCKECYNKYLREYHRKKRLSKVNKSVDTVHDLHVKAHVAVKKEFEKGTGVTELVRNLSINLSTIARDLDDEYNVMLVNEAMAHIFKVAQLLKERLS
jgi:hypothetical protein